MLFYQLLNNNVCNRHAIENTLFLCRDIVWIENIYIITSGCNLIDSSLLLYKKLRHTSTLQVL